jgi:hypothetical protein
MTPLTFINYYVGCTLNVCTYGEIGIWIIIMIRQRERGKS